MKKIYYFSAILAFSGIWSCDSQKNPEVTIPELKSHLDYLAGNELKGRYPGTAEDSLLLLHISDEFKSTGLEFFSGNGIQNFDFISSSKQGNNNSIIINTSDTATSGAFMPFSFTSNLEITAPVAFAGYGFELKNDTISRNDYNGIDVKGKWVIILRGNPVSQDKKNAYSNAEKDRDKAMLAKDKGAAGVFLVSGNKYDSQDILNAMSINLSELGIPCMQIKREIADKILASEKKTIVQLEDKMAQVQIPIAFETKSVVKAHTEVNSQKTVSGNVYAFLRGSNPDLEDEYIVIGAHHDHLGMGGKGSSSRTPDTTAIHYGADDNASGVAAILELAEKLKKLKPGRSIIFATFGAEEKGLIGSAYFAANPPVPIEKIRLMLNLDMVGRLRDSSLQIGGVGTSVDFKDYLTGLEKTSGFIFSLSSAGYGPSDHASFYAKDKPVLFFSTGAHSDYHTPSDVADSINFEGLKSITSFVAELAMHYSNTDSGLIFQEAGPKESSSSRYRGKVSLGIMPDVSSEGTAGLKVLAVSEGKPAANAGLLKGDVIVEIDGKPVGNIQDYMFRLGQLKPGDRAMVGVIRKGEKLEILVQL